MFSELAQAIKSIPMLALSADTADHFECVIALADWPHLNETLERLLGVEKKSADELASAKIAAFLKDQDKNNGDERHHFFKQDEQMYCATVSPWKDGSAITIKVERISLSC